MRIFLALGCLVATISISAYEFKDSMHLLKEAYSVASFELGETLKDKSRYSFSEGRMTLNESEGNHLVKYKFRFYLPKNLKKTNLIVLTPNIEGLTVLERRLAHRLANEGYPVLVPFDRGEKLTFDQETAQKMERIVRRAMAGTFHLIEKIESSFPEINTEEMGLIGASLGGIRSSILFGLDPRFKAAFLSVAGGDIPLLYGITQLEVLADFREKHMSALGFETAEQYTEYLRSALFLDPLIITQSPNLKGVALIIAEKDDVVPTVNQWRLFSEIKKAGVHPKTFPMNVSHVRGALELIIKEKTLLNWLEKHL
ncbi:MAG: prolyl oligopeptidase family serine peptidase [Halobacteriovoraceae bacterium]|nr:prolyl oligopeptidase family serine peptidase [Halobacteriovoraceae bacterium]